MSAPRYNPQRVAALIEERTGNKVKKLADKLKVSVGTIRNWKKGKQTPDAQQLVDLAEALWADVSDFYDPPKDVN